MAERTTDGAPSASVDPGSSAAWESVLASSIGEVASETGLDLNAPIPADPLEAAPQTADRGSSANVSATPPADRTGDDGATPGTVRAPEAALPASTPAAAVSPDAPPTPDPIPGAQPFTYDVDGQGRTIEGAFRIPGEGLYVPEDAVPRFQAIAARAETLEREQHTHRERYDALERATTWPGPKDASGKLTELRGIEALQAQRSLVATTLAKLNKFEQALSDPAQATRLTRIVDTGQRDANGEPVFAIAWNPDGLEMLRTNAKLAAVESDQRALQHLRTISAPPSPPQPTTQDVLQSHASVTVEAFEKQYQITGLTKQDREFLVAEFPRYGIQGPNGLSVDPRFLDVMKDRAAMRAELQKTAAAAETAGKFNGGMNRGRVGSRPVAPPKVPVTPAAPPQKVGRAAAWDSVLADAMQDIEV